MNFIDPSGLISDCAEATRQGALSGAAAGTLLGGATAIVCDVGSGGVCTLGNPLIIAGGASLGSAVGGLGSNAMCHLGNLLDNIIWSMSSSETTTGVGVKVIEGGAQTTPAPYSHTDEQEFLDMGPFDPCKKIKEMIEKMEKQIEWRKGDLNRASSSYQGHVQRIKILEAQLKKLAGYLAMNFCS